MTIASAVLGIRYRVDLGDPRERHFKVTLKISAPAAQQVVSLPSWIPGSYLLREFARHLRDLSATQAGRPVVLEQLDKATWRCIDCAAGETLELSWRVYAGDNSVRTAFLDAQRGFFNGTSLFLRVHGREQELHVLELAALPEGWQLATAMTQTGERAFVAADYDELVDHPFELGRFWRGRFSAGGIEHHIAVAGALPVFDGERLLADTQKICAAQMAFWDGNVPFKSYTFLLNTVDDGYGGLEHRASTALIAARRDLPRLGQAEVGEGYLKLLGLISHEYFHSWNVKRLRPAEFASYDYTRENYSELLWFFEGFTSYFDDLLLVRAGLIDEARYLKLLAGHVSSLLATPGRKAQSLARASFEAWIKYYRPDENSPNATVSYYGKGALLGLAVDLSLRRQGSSLDAVMRGLWQRSGGGPVSEADILAVVAELGGPELAQTLKDWVHGTDELPLQALLEGVAVHWRADDRPSLAQRLGLRVSESALAGVSVKQVLSGSAAEAAGFCAGDELLGCNGWRLRRLDDALLTLAAGEPALGFLVSRDQRLIELRLAEAPAAVAPGAAGVTLSLADKAPPAALALRSAWLLGG